MEGPGVRTIADRLAPLVGKRVTSLEGRSRFPLGSLAGEPLELVYPVGKLLFASPLAMLQLLFHRKVAFLRFPGSTLRVHFLMWGRYRLDREIPGKVPRLTLSFGDGHVLKFYASAIALLPNEEVERLYDPALDPMDPSWDIGRAARLVRGKGGEEIGDSLQDQAILPGVGNIIRNEALFAGRVHPASPSDCIPTKALSAVLGAIRDFFFTWFHCDAEGTRINPHLKIYRKKTCPGCGGPVESGRTAVLGRISSWCPACQVMYRCPEGSGKRHR